MAQVFNFEVLSPHVVLRFSCPNHERRIAEALRNLCPGGAGGAVDVENDGPAPVNACLSSRFTALQGEVSFAFNGSVASGHDVRHEAVFFENTDYPLIARASPGVVVEEMSLAVNNRLHSGQDSQSTVISFAGELYGSVNFKNQVGLTNFSLRYRLRGEASFRSVGFLTEVLSYKLDYRADLKTIISDIEHEYAMLSSSFLKDTYLSFRQHLGPCNDLVWWQIFRSCYADIVAAARLVIGRPRRRLHPVPSLSRADSLRSVPPEVENDYALHRYCPGYLFRCQDLAPSNDTVENRFLKYVLRSLSSRFLALKQHILTAMHLDDPLHVDSSLPQMEAELLGLCNHPFFRGVGPFRGFSQDSLVMKQAPGYRSILQNYILLQQGFVLEEGMHKLEVKDVSDLYEIWCFIKVKNIVQDTLSSLGILASPFSGGRMLSADFIPQLVYGGSVSFLSNESVELAAVSYNSQVTRSGSSQISGTNSITTEQRPDIVLRLSKKSTGPLKFTYLFDAKYRIGDVCVGGEDVPPEDAINQMHRYRDSIYYTADGLSPLDLKKEIIAGYVLFPGRVSPASLASGEYYYQRSNNLIGIGAFPLRPSAQRHSPDGGVLLDPDCSEVALRSQIRLWLQSDNLRQDLLQWAVPQKGLDYTLEAASDESDLSSSRGPFLLSTVDPYVNVDPWEFASGSATSFCSGYAAILSGINFKNVRFFAPVVDQKVRGYFAVLGCEAVDVSLLLNQKRQDFLYGSKSPSSSSYKGFDKPFRISLSLGDYTRLPAPFSFPKGAYTARGVTLGKREFEQYCKKNLLP